MNSVSVNLSRNPNSIGCAMKLRHGASHYLLVPATNVTGWFEVPVFSQERGVDSFRVFLH
jgi:hypothetical protein